MPAAMKALFAGRGERDMPVKDDTFLWGGRKEEPNQSLDAKRRAKDLEVIGSLGSISHFS